MSVSDTNTSNQESAGPNAIYPQPAKRPAVAQWLFWAILTLLMACTLYRVFPVLKGQPALSEFFLTEDGYLLLTVARNMAIGLGMSVSDGTIPTNGVQPLITFLFTLPYLITGGDKVTSLIGVNLIAAAISVASFFAVRAFAGKVLAAQSSELFSDPLWPWLAAALWFTGPLLLLHTMNGLETGLYTMFVLLSLLQFSRVVTLGIEAGTMDRLALGALCGLTFLARNDGAFLVMAIFALWGLRELVGLRIGFGVVLRRVVPPGLVTLAFAAPWMISNQINFGSIIPISGSAQSIGISFGQNATLLPAKLFEYVLPMFPVPNGIEQRPVFIFCALAVVVVVLLWFFWRALRSGGPICLVIAAYAIYAATLIGYYGFNFGAPHFLSRYLAPAAPLLIVAALTSGLALAHALSGPKAFAVASWTGLAGLALSTILLARLLFPGVHEHEHFQVVRWVEANVPDEDWAGAVQTGTLGYWHDRTINLDGKVNPEALAVLREEGNILRYVTESEIQYLADWYGIADWVNRGVPDFTEAFEVVVEDPEANLGVLRRYGAPVTQ